MWLLKGSETSGDGPEASAAGQEVVISNEDMKEQFEQQQVLLQQLKDLVRKNEQQLLKKEQDLEGSAAKLSKLKLQHKAKIVQLNNKLQDAQKKISGPITEKNPDDEETNEALPVDTSRGKVLMLKKQLEESKAIFEKRQKEMADKKHTVEEVLTSLKIQLEEKDKIIAQFKSENPDDEDARVPAAKQDDTSLQEMYAQIVYKDSKIMDLDSRILQLERQVMDLQENVKEKEEVIQTRNKAIQLMTEDLNRRGKVVVDQLGDTRDQMRLMQENFAAMEADWRAKESSLVGELDEAKMKFNTELLEKEDDISVLKTSFSKLENVRFELISRNAQLQEKVVRLQEMLEKVSVRSSEDESSRLQSEIDQLKDDLKKKDLIISELQQSVGGTSKSNNQKLIKLKAQHKSQVRSLELQIKELKSCPDAGDQVTTLQNRIADLEEEKGNLQLRLVDFDEYSATCGQQQKQIAELKEKLLQQSSDLDDHVKMISMVQGKHLDTIEQLAEKNRLIENLEVTHHETNTQFQNEREIKAHLEVELNNMKTSIEVRQASYEELSTKLEAVKSECEQLRNELSSMENEKFSLEAVNEELREAVLELRNNLTTALADSDGMTENLSSKSELIEKLQEELLEASQEFHKEIENLKIDKDNSNLLIQTKDAYILQQTKEIDKLSNTTTKLTTELHSKTEEVNTLSEKIAQLSLELNSNIDGNNKEEKRVNDKMVSLIEQLGETEAEVGRLQTLCSEYDIKFQTTEKERDDALDKLLNNTQILSKTQNELSQMEEQIAALVKQQDGLQNTIQESVIRIDELNMQLIQKEDHLNAIRNDMADLEDRLRQAIDRLQEETSNKENVENQLGQLKTLLESKREEVENLQSVLQAKDVQCLNFQTELQSSLNTSDEYQKRINELMDERRIFEESVTLHSESQMALKQTIVELQHELKQTLDKLTETISELDELKEKLNDEILAKQNLETKLQVLEKDHEILIEEKHEEIKHLNLKLELLESEGGTHEEWAKTLESNLTNLKLELHNSVQLIAELETQVSLCKASEERLIQENVSAREEYEQIASQCADKSHALEIVAQELQNTRTDLKNVSTCLEEANSQLESRSSMVEALQVALKAVKEELVVTISEQEAVEAENANLNERLLDMDQKLGEMSPKLDRLNSMETELTLLQEKFENCRENHEIETTRLRSEIDDLCLHQQGKDSELKEKSQALQESLEIQQRDTAKLHNLKEALQNCQGQLDIIAKERDDLRMSVERLQLFEVEFHKQVDNIGLLESEVKKLSEEGSRLRDQSARLMEYIQQLEADLSTTSEAAKEIESEQNVIYAGLTECLEKLRSIVNKGSSLEIEIERANCVQETEKEDSNFKSLIQKFDALHINLQMVFEGMDEQIMLSTENNKKTQSTLSEAQENYALLSVEKQELEQTVLQFMDLKNQIQTLTEHNSEVEQRLAIVSATNQALEETLHKQNEESLSVNEYKLKLEQELEALQTKMCTQEELIKSVQSDFSDSQQQSESYQVQIQQMTEHVQSLQCDASEQVQSLSGKLEFANKEVQTLQSEVQKLQGEALQQDVSIAELKSSLEEFKIKYEESRVLNKEQEMLIHQFTEQVSTTEKEVQSRQLEIESLSGQLDHLRNKLTDTEMNLKADADILQVQTSEIDKLQQFVNEKEKHLETVVALAKQEKEAFQVKIEDLENSLKIANKIIEDFQDLVSNVNQEILHEKESNGKLKQELEKMHKEARFNEHIQNAEEEWQLQIRDLECKNQELQRHLEEAESIKCQLQAEIKEKCELCNDYQLRLDQKIADVDTVNERLRALTHIISQLKNSLPPNINNETEHDGEVSEISLDHSYAILTKVEETIRENNENINVLKSSITSLQEAMELNAVKVSDLESSNERFRGEAEQLKEQHTFLQTQLGQSFETDVTIEMLQNELKNSAEEKQAMQESFNEQENVIRALLDQRRHLEERLNEFQDNLTRDAMEIDRLYKENSCLEEKLVCENNAEEALQQEISNLNHQLQSVDNLKGNLEELENLNRILSEEKNLLETKLNSLNIQSDENKSNLYAQIENLKAEVSLLQEVKMQYEEQLQRLLEESKKLKEEKSKYDSLANRFADEGNQFEDMKSEHEKLKLCNKELNDKLQALESQLQDRKNAEDVVTKESSTVPLPSLTKERLLGAFPAEHPGVPANLQSPPDATPESKQLKTQLAVLQIKNEKMLSKLKLFKDKNDKLQLQINNLMTTQGFLEDDKMRLSHYNENAKDEIGRLSSELRNVERLWKSEVKMLQDRLDTVEVANYKIVEIKEDIERKLMKHIDQGKIIMDEKTTAEQSLSEALAKLQLQESVHKENVDQMILKQAQLERQLDSLQKHETFLESDNTEFQHLIEKLRLDKAKSDQDIKVQSEKYILLVQEHNKLKAELEDLRTQLEDVGDVSYLKKSYTSLQKEYKELVNVKLHLESEAEYLKSELNAAVDNKASLEMEVRSAKSLLLETLTVHETVSYDQIEKQDAEPSDLCQAIQKLTKELVNAKFENEELKTKASQSQLDNLENQNMSNDLDEVVTTLKNQNSDLLDKISRLEGDIWKLEDEKQQIVDATHFNEQKSLNKALADVEKLQAENKKLIEELDNQDVDLKQLETEKDEIEAEARLTFHQQQDAIKDLRAQLQHREEEAVQQNSEENDATDVQNLNTELTSVKQILSENVLQLELEKEKSLLVESKYNKLRNEIIDLREDLKLTQDDKHELDVQLSNLESVLNSTNEQLEHWKSQYYTVAENRTINAEALQRQSPNFGYSQPSESSTGEEIQLWKVQIEKLSSELQHTIQSLHAKDLRCEQLTSEIMQLIEERDSLQLRLSSLLRADQKKDMKMKLLERQLLAHPNSPSALSDAERSNNSYEEQNNSKVCSEPLDKKLRESEEQRKELQQINALLDQALAAEREHRIKITADLKFAKEELAGLVRRPKLKRETILTVDEDDDGQVPLLPEHSQTLERSYMRTSWRISNWIQGRSTPRIMHV